MQLLPHEVLCIVRKFNLKDNNENDSKASLVLEILLHPDYDTQKTDFDADIAVLLLDQQVHLGNDIPSLCLPQASSGHAEGSGVVVGWGKSEHSDPYEFYDSTPNKLVVPIVENSQCFATYPDLQLISSERTFCGGYKNQSKGICSGDSGGGLYVKESESSPYIVQGIISSSPLTSTGFAQTCDIQKYAVYTNVAAFIDWIQEVVGKTKELIDQHIQFECAGEP